MKLIIKNAAGFSMVQGLIVAGIVAGSSLVTTRLMNDQKKAQKTAEVKDKLEEFHQTIYSTLQHKQNCKQTILANGYQAEIVTNNALDLSMIQSYDDSGTARTVATVGEKYMNDTIIINSMVLLPPPLNSGTRVFKVNYSKISNNNKQTGKRIYGGNNIDRTFTVRIQKNRSDNSFSSCYSITAAETALFGVASSEVGNDINAPVKASNDITKEMCNEMVTGAGQSIFTWDENRSLCVPNAQCPFGQIYTGIDQDGTVKCKDIRDWMDFTEVLDQSMPPVCPINSSVRFVIDEAIKKVRISCGVCTSSCDCPNSTDVCEGNICVNRSVGCIDGTFARGDAACMYLCTGGYWSCPASQVACSSSTGATTGGGGTTGGGATTGGGGGCFIAGTEITLFDGTKKNIEDIGLGESLIDLKGSKVKVQKLISYDYEGPIYSINGGPYFFTPNHPFLTTSGWKSLDPKKSMEEAPDLQVSHLMLGDILLKKDGVEVVLSLDSMNIKDKVYNFTLDGTHEYIANDYAVHNKMQVVDPNTGAAVFDPLLPSI